jgi:hypothetical protein
MSILPISPDTIIYGSCDAGRHIHAHDIIFNEKMMQAAKLLNLKPHKVKLSGEGEVPKLQFQQTESPLVIMKHQARMSRTMPELPSASHRASLLGSDPTSDSESDVMDANANADATDTETYVSSLRLQIEYSHANDARSPDALLVVVVVVVNDARC